MLIYGAYIQAVAFPPASQFPRPTKVEKRARTSGFPEDTCARALRALLTPIHTSFVPAGLLGAFVKELCKAPPGLPLAYSKGGSKGKCGASGEGRPEEGSQLCKRQ